MSTKRGAEPRPARKLWTDEDYGLVQSDQFTRQELADMLSVSPTAITNARKRIESGDDQDQARRFTADEDDLIREHGPSLTAKQLGAMLGRPWQSVSDRRRKLGVAATYNTDPLRIGGRPLVAKTCYGCGLLLQADWFGFYPSRRRWSSRCRKCQSAYTTSRPGNRRYQANRAKQAALAAKAWIAEMQEYTRERASRSGLPYTEVDHRTLADKDLTHLDKAMALGRTWVAIATACRTFGYKSHVGLGDPARDQWSIDNPNESRLREANVA